MNEQTRKDDNKPIIAISIGDINGIGPEVTIKALSDSRVIRSFVPVIYADGRILSYYKKLLKTDSFSYNQIKDLKQVHTKKVNVLNLTEDSIDINPGTVSKEAGSYAVTSLERAMEDLQAGKVDALVTSPLSKDNSQSDAFQYPGHTEYLTAKDGASESLMFLISEGLRVGVATGHIPLKEVPVKLTKELIRSKLTTMIHSLKKDFGIKKPRVAVLGLNPHAGENGLLGNEEELIIAPIITELKEKGHLVFGPFASDGFFGSPSFKGFDGILAMYHDQGLTPFKSMAFDTGVNFTAGLSFVRTSPDHGTAYGMAGKGMASEHSMRNAMYAAADIVKARREDS